MKTFVERLREMPIDALKAKIRQQEADIHIAQRDLETMRTVLTAVTLPPAPAQASAPAADKEETP